MDKLTKHMIIKSGRSWWQARYSDGKVLSEWDTAKLWTAGHTSRWEEVKKDNMVGLRLLCPDGNAGELEASEGHKLFQLKVGGFELSVRGSYCDAHIIGVVTDTDGSCFCFAWEVAERKLIKFKDNVRSMAYRQIGQLSLEVQGLRI